MSRRPGLVLQMPTPAEQSYRVDENGAFVHGAVHIGADGLVMAGHGGQGDALSHEEADDLKTLRKDTRFEDLEFLEKLGEGNSSVVHRAHDRRLNRDFAVKRINIYDRSRRHQIIKELHTLYRCDCPHLVGFHGAFFKEGAISIAIEFMDVGSLADVLSVARSIAEPELAYLARQLLQGLDFLRRAHKLHRDVKPSNIVLNSQAECKLSDFGIATSLDSTLAACQSFVGTSAYMSPERLLGQSYKYPADIYSIGLVFLECALGRFPYDVNGVVLDLMTSIINGPSPTLPREGVASGRWSPEFANFIDCCLCKDPESRSTAAELLLHPWMAKHAATRTQAQMVQWLAGIKTQLDQRRASGDEHSAASGGVAMDTSTSGVAGSAGGAPFDAAYNNTTTTGAGGAQAARHNVPADAASSFYQVKEIK